MLDTIAHFYAGEPDGPRVIEAWSAVLDTILGLLRAGSGGRGVRPTLQNLTSPGGTREGTGGA